MSGVGLVDVGDMCLYLCVCGWGSRIKNCHGTCKNKRARSTRTHISQEMMIHDKAFSHKYNKRQEPKPNKRK